MNILRQIIFLSFAVLFAGCQEKELSFSELRNRAEQGDVAAQRSLGKMYLMGQYPGGGPDYDQASRWLTKATISGHDPVAAYLLGTMHLKGDGVPKNEGEGFKYILQAAERGVAAAQNRTGERYLFGQGVPRDFAQAADWFEKAARQGLAEAQYNYGQRIFKAEGRRQSDAEAAKWLLRAANQGHRGAQVQLGRRFADGGAGSIDCVQAYKWATLAGDDVGVKAAARRMTKAQTETAKAQADSFIPVLELDPYKPPKSNLVFWLLGVPVLGLYAGLVYRSVKKTAPTLQNTPK